MRISLQLSHENNKIQFYNREHGILGYTTYQEEIWKELNKVNWYARANIDNKEKNYIYTGSNYFNSKKHLHQAVMQLWYGEKEVEEAYANKCIIEHHNNDEFDNTIENLSFALNDLNLTKAHSFDKNQPKLLPQVGINFYKDFKTQQYQITLIFTASYSLEINNKSIIIDSLYLLYDNNFRLVYTDANRIVDEILENKMINFRLLSYKKLGYKEATFYHLQQGEKLSGINFIQNENGETVMIISEDMQGKIIFNSTPPNPELYKK